MRSVKTHDLQCYPKIGLLPFYISLYDESLPSLRQKVAPFVQTISQALSERNLQVETVEPCRVREEFSCAISHFEQQNIDAIVTLHLAYSPSLESVDALTATALPLIVLDTTPAFEFGPNQDPDEVLTNHGIHGVQDMCNLLIRRDKPFVIETGHWQQSDVLDRVAEHVQSISLSRKYRSLRIGLLGHSFPGMGDFAVSEESIRKTLGFEVVPGDFSLIRTLRDNITEKEISKELAENRLAFTGGQISEDILRRAAVSGLILRKWIDYEQLSGFSINFLDIDSNTPFPCMPFLEISKAMVRGTGYAGEGDVLTASLMSLIHAINHDVSFTEMFCPDWKNGNVFLSHMGEINLNLTASRPVMQEIEFPYTDVGNTLASVGAFRSGRATLLNLAPVGNERYRLLVSPGQVLDSGTDDRFVSSIRGWFKPDLPLEKFLQTYSQLGGTHHLLIAYHLNHRLVHLIGHRLGWQVVDLTPSQ